MTLPEFNLKSLRLFISLLVFAAGIGFLAGTWVDSSRVMSGVAEQPPIRLPRQGNYNFISPLLVDTDVTNNNDQLSEILQNKIHEATYDFVDDPSINLVSVYFRDLSSARSVSIKADQLFDSGSLLKISLLIAALKEGEAAPGFLSEKVVYPGRARPPSNGQFEGLVTGQVYTIADLLNYMIVKSDNDAKDLLYVTLDPLYINGLYQSLKLGVPDPNSHYQISPRTFSYFFRILYNASYLTPDDSDYALSLLTKSDYANGLVAGVPNGTSVAHKYGQVLVPNPKQPQFVLWELHDCGIVYYPNRPYFLCVMTRGDNLQNLASIISKTSEVVYGEVGNNLQ